MKSLALLLLLAMLWAVPVHAAQDSICFNNVPGSPNQCQPVTPTNPFPVTPSGGNTGGYDTSIANTPTVTVGAYALNNAIGGLQQLSFFRTTTQPSGILNNISVASKGGSTQSLTIYIFTSNPSLSTCTDKVAFSLNAADVGRIIPSGPLTLTPALVGTGTSVTFAAQQMPVVMRNRDSPVTLLLYMCAVVGGAVTPASTTDLIFKIGGIQD